MRCRAYVIIAFDGDSYCRLIVSLSISLSAFYRDAI